MDVIKEQKINAIVKTKNYFYINPFAVFWHENNEVFMFENTSEQVINLTKIIKLFIDEYRDTDNLEIKQEVIFKVSDLKNIADLSLYNKDSLRAAYASIFLDLTNLYFKNLIDDTSYKFKNTHIHDKYHFIFKNLGFGGIQKKSLINARNWEKVSSTTITKSFKKENFFVLRIEPKFESTRSRLELGTVIFNKLPDKDFLTSIYSDTKFIFLTEESFHHIYRYLGTPNLQKKNVGRFVKFYADPEVYKNNYYHRIIKLNPEYFKYNLGEVNKRDILKLMIFIPEIDKRYKIKK